MSEEYQSIDVINGRSFEQRRDDAYRGGTIYVRQLFQVFDDDQDLGNGKAVMLFSDDFRYSKPNVIRVVKEWLFAEFRVDIHEWEIL